jgi:RHS repeat-associated protein
MKLLRAPWAGIAFAAFASAAFAAQQPLNPSPQVAESYTHATRYNDRGQVTGTIAPDPDGAGVLHYAATRNTYGPENTATSGMLVKVEKGELSSWSDQGVNPENWTSFTVFLTTLIEYDGNARKVKETVLGTNGSAESLVQYSYDGWDRVKCRAVRMNKAAYGALPTDACQVGAPGGFGPDRITRYTYDDLGQVIVEERAVGTPQQQFYVTNTYDVTNKRLLTSQTDANNNKTAIEYDANFRLKKRFYPSPTVPGAANYSDFNWYEYDNNGNVIVEHKRDGRTIGLQYDPNNRLIVKNLSDNTYSDDVVYDYDLRGLTLASCFARIELNDDELDDACRTSGQGETNDFDGFGNLIIRTSRMAGVSRILTYQYDFEGNRTRVTHPDTNFFSYGFDGLNRFNVLMENAVVGSLTPPLLTVDYRPGGGRLNITRTGGAVTSIVIDNARRLGSFTQDLAGSANDLINGFDYNPSSQVVKLSQSNALYTYAEFKSRVGTYTPNGLNQYTNVDESPVGYDPNGNLTTDAGTGTTFTYDMENHLVAVSGTIDSQAVSATLVYDVLGRLSQTTINAGTSVTTQLHYDGDALIGEYEGSALTKRYVHGDQVDEPLVQYSTNVATASTRQFLHADHQGSVIAHSDSIGTSVQSNSYDSYGIPATTNDGRFGYTGQTWLKQLGLNYYKARVYSPRLGRFLQTDPIFYKDDMNLYAYVGSDPMSRHDPYGTYECSVTETTKTCTGTAKEAAAMKAEFKGYLIVKNEKFDSSSEKFFDIGIDPGNRGNTVAANGKDGLMTQYGADNDPGAHPVVREGVHRHELKHIHQIFSFARNLDLLKGLPKGMPISIKYTLDDGPIKWIFEHQAYDVERKFLRERLQNSTDEREKDAIRDRLRGIKDLYR